MSFILYQQDIDNAKPMIHWSTKNASFIRIALVLKRMGIKNHLFPLTLLQPELERVDPFASDLDEKTRTRILVEAKLNPWYFFRECLKVPVVGGDNIPFQLSRGNLASIWCFFNDIDFGLVMPRQTGKSYATQAILMYAIYILADNITIGHFDKDQTNCANIIRVIKDLRGGMPKWMYELSGADTDRKESISYARKNNTYLTFPSPIDERSAYKLGRGLTASILHLDEIAFINYNWIIVPTAANAMLKATEMARKAGIPSPMIYTTTAGNPDTPAGSFALSIFERACPFTESLYDLQDRNALKEVVEQNSTNHMLYLEFSYRQLGKTDAWFEDAARRSNASQDDINRDLLNIWQSATDRSVIPKDLLNKIRSSKRDPSWSDLDDGFVIRWYVQRPYVESGKFAQMPSVLGTDTSENIGRDFTTFTCLSPADGSVIFTCRCNDSNVMMVARFVTRLLLKYPKMVWIPERQSTAATIIDFVLEEFQKQKINPFLRIFNEVIQNYQDPQWKNIDIYNYSEIFGKTRAAFGYRTSGGTTGTSRNTLYKQTMMKTLELNHNRIYDSRLINELCGLELRNGRVDHRNGGHDDQVISYLLAAFLIFFGKNLHMYGIDTTQLLSNVTTDGNVVSQNARNEQIAIKRRISELEEKLALQPCTTLAYSYQRELNDLKNMVDDSITVVEPLAVTQIKEQERQIHQHTNSEALVRNFANRWTMGWQQRYNPQRKMTIL